jgi:Fe-S cluster assembly protein SufB
MNPTSPPLALESTLDLTQKTHIFEHLTRDLFDASDVIAYKDILTPGLDEKKIRAISAANGEPEWMLEHRLVSYRIFCTKKLPTWGPDLSALNLDDIYYFGRPEGMGNATSWEDVPETIKNTFERLGIPVRWYITTCEKICLLHE